MKDDMYKLNDIKELLEKEGFRTSWSNPFMKWQHPDIYSGKSESETGKVLYVRDFPVPWIVPFDLAMVSIKIDDEGIYFELSLYYVNVMEDQTEVSVINEIYDHHQFWHDCMVDCFIDVGDRFSLKWDTEYDVYIEDSLYGHFESGESILNILIILRNMDENRWPVVPRDAAGWSSKVPEIDCKLKKYRDCINLVESIPYW
jgi:hypothetical protein